MLYQINRKSCRIHRNAYYQLSEAIPVTALCYPERLCHTIQPRMPLNPQERLLPALRSYTLSSYAILLRYAISDKPNQPANSAQRFAHIRMLSRKNTFFHMLMITYLYAILSRYAILRKPELSNNSVRRLALILMLSRKNTFFYMLMIAYLYAILRRYAILRKPELSNNSVRRLTSANRSHIAYFLCCTYYFLPPAPFS